MIKDVLNSIFWAIWTASIILFICVVYDGCIENSIGGEICGEKKLIDINEERIICEDLANKEIIMIKRNVTRK